MLSLEQQNVIPSVLQKTSLTIQTAVAHDFSPCFELDARCKADPNLLEEFIKNPEGVALREVGFKVPEGFHLHFIDKNNNYYPSEGDAISQLVAGEHGKIWTRVEIRMAAGPGCIAACGVCW